MPNPNADLDTNPGASTNIPTMIISNGYLATSCYNIIRTNTKNVVSLLRRTDGGIQFRFGAGLDNNLTTEQVAELFAGVSFNYVLATPTDQPAITLPEDIAIEKGGTIQATYDNSNQVPADFDFEVAVYKPMQ